MDFLLRCNSLKCRRQLNDRAVVTTCSHIFCIACSEALGLASANVSNRICPACEMQLSNPDDAVATQLNPTEDYKTSVLSGLSPSIILECAGRGLSFYSYQTTQEIVYQEYLAKTLADKYNTLSGQMDNVIHDANTEIASLRDKLQAMQGDQRALEKQNRELADALRKKSKTEAQTRHLYNALKRQQLAGGIELAAEYDAENVVQAVHHRASNGPEHAVQSRAASISSGRGRSERPQPHTWSPSVGISRHAVQNAHQAGMPDTPSTHRQRLSGPVQGLRQPGANRNVAARSPLGVLDANACRGTSNIEYGGMSAGIKVGRQLHGPSPLNHGAGSARSGGSGGYIR